MNPPTPRQLEIMAAVLRTGSAKIAAAELGIAYSTVKNQQTALFKRLGVTNRCEAHAAIVGRRMTNIHGDDGLRAAAQAVLDDWDEPDPMPDGATKTAHRMEALRAALKDDARARVDTQEWALLDACHERDIYSPEDLTAALSGVRVPPAGSDGEGTDRP